MNIRNFVIIAHVDHGKSTLADRFLELTGTVEKRRMREQFLDMHPLEREKGITIKMQPVRMIWKSDLYPVPKISNPQSSTPDKSSRSTPGSQNDHLGFINSDLGFADSEQEFILNLIDTPGHADFSYEVSRALACVEGAILLVDATQGVQAQTIANLHLAQNEKMVIIPAINKIDLPSAEIEKTEKEIMALLGCGAAEIYRLSAKTGQGVEEILNAVVEKVPSPRSRSSLPPNHTQLSALIFDSLYDPYLGVITHIRVFEGLLRKGERIKFLAVQSEAEALEVGIFRPERTPTDVLSAGEIGYLATGVKEPDKIRVGDTVTRYIDISKYRVDPLPGYQEPNPMVFASIFPENQDEHEFLRESLQKLKLNDPAFSFEPEDTSAIGRGFRAGFLGMLHMEIVAERLHREYGLEVVFTNPSVAFRVKTRRGEEKIIHSASKIPEPYEVEYIEEPWVDVEVVTPLRFLGSLTTLINERSGILGTTENMGEGRLLVKFRAPLRWIIMDFHDRLKSISEGFASVSYGFSGWQRADLVKMEILIAGDRISALSEIVPRDRAYFMGKEKVLRLKEVLPRELFSVALQAEVEGRILARETIQALRKDVTGYLYGGDRTRKMKLWKKQQKGKRKLKERGRVDIAPEVFLKMLKK